MKFSQYLTVTAPVLLSLFGATSAGLIPGLVLHGVPTPQEHSHDNWTAIVRGSLSKNNPEKLGDPVVALLGNQNAAAGLGPNFKDVFCLQSAIADQAFTNAKAGGDKQGMIAAMLYRSFQRNGLNNGFTETCTSFKPVNPEIAALQQHQNPDQTESKAANRKSTFLLAIELDKFGADPALALQAGTFVPGDKNAKGQPVTCDGFGPADPVDGAQQDFNNRGCIFELGLLNPDATEAEIQKAVCTGNSDF